MQGESGAHSGRQSIDHQGSVPCSKQLVRYRHQRCARGRPDHRGIAVAARRLRPTSIGHHSGSGSPVPLMWSSYRRAEHRCSNKMQPTGITTVRTTFRAMSSQPTEPRTKHGAVICETMSSICRSPEGINAVIAMATPGWGTKRRRTCVADECGLTTTGSRRGRGPWTTKVVGWDV